MKINILILNVLIPGCLLSQVGINTTNPTKTLDVNGEVRIRTLNNVSLPNVMYLVAADSQGNLSRATPFDTMYSSGIYVSSITNNQWSNIRMSTKGTRLDFVGRAAMGSGIDFTFSVFYDYGAGFSIISSPVIEGGSSINVSGISATSFRVSITSGATTENFLFTISAPSSDLSNIVVSNINGIVVKGTFVSEHNMS